MHRVRKYNSENLPPENSKRRKLRQSTNEKKQLPLQDNQFNINRENEVTKIKDNELSSIDTDKENLQVLVNFEKPSVEPIQVYVESNTVGSDKLYHERITSIVQKIKSYNEKISMGGEATDLPTLPGLSVKGYGEVPLPMNETNANSLIKLSKNNTKLKGIHEFDLSLIKMLNPSWKIQVNNLVKKISKQFGCSKSLKVTSKLSKVVIYEKGAFLTRQQDECDIGVFATLLIQLPSLFEGGEFILHDEDKSIIYNFGASNKKSRFSVNYLAHFAGIEFEVGEIKSGYRLMLVYSLYWPLTNLNSMIKPLKRDELCKEMTSALIESFDNNKYEYSIILDHRYKFESLEKDGLNALRGSDMARLNFLKEINKNLPSEKQLKFYVVYSPYLISSIHYKEGIRHQHKDPCNNDESSSSEDENYEVVSDSILFDETDSQKGWVEEQFEEFITYVFNEYGKSIEEKREDRTIETISTIINPHVSGKKPWHKNKQIDINYSNKYTGLITGWCDYRDYSFKRITYQKFYLLFCTQSYADELFMRNNNFKNTFI